MKSCRAALVVGLALVLAVVVAPSASAAAPRGSTGHDVSYPQCGGPLPAGGAFGIVGVTRGRPWSANPCLSGEYAWANAQPNAAALYVNTANPAPTSSYYWPASGASDPVLCQDNSSTTDPGCAYDYGWHAAANALTVANAASSTAAQRTWWLDVETANSWNGDGTSNAADLQGEFDYLRSHGVPTVGLYSTGYQWGLITGGYTASSAPRYRSAWQPEFTPRYPMESAALWIAGTGSVSNAAAACGTSFTGATATLAQYVDGTGFDADLVCGQTATRTTARR